MAVTCEASPSLSPNNNRTAAATTAGSKRGGFSLFRRGQHTRKRALRPPTSRGGGDGRSEGAVGGGGGGRGRLNTDIILEDDEDESSIDVRAAAPNEAANTIFVPRDNQAVDGGGDGVGIQQSTRSFSFSPFFVHTVQHNVGVGTSTTWSDIPQQQQQQLTDDGCKYSVNLLERGLRQIVIGCTMFLAGNQYLGGATVAHRILELSLVAWGTCLFIMIMSWFQRDHNTQQQQQQQQLQQQLQHQHQLQHQYSRPMTASTPLINNTTRATSMATGPTERLEDDTDTERSPLRKKRSYNATTVPSKLFRDISKLTESEGGTVDVNNDWIKYRPQAINTTDQPATSSQSLHPHLANLYIICDQERIFPNVLVDIDTDFFIGKMLLMFRTPEVDEAMSSSSEDPVVTYFRGKQRRFEFQWQLRLKKLPPGDVFLGAEIDEPVQMGMIQRALANAALKFTKKLNTGFSAELMPDSGPAYLSFPVGTSMDRLNATKVGDPLPTLGGEIPEDPEVMKVRKKGTAIEWSMDNVYTMALWSAYADWSEWSIMNFPGIRPFSITSMVGVQPVKLTLYSQKEHDREVIIAMEVSHATLATMGSQARSWVVRNLDLHDAKPSEVTVDSEIDSYNGNSHVDGGEDIEEFPQLDDPEISSCVLSGSSLSLREGIANYLANGGGYALLQTSPPPLSFFVLEKVQMKTKKRASDYTTSIRSGDVVRVQLVDATTNNVKYLTIHQGWWLRWISARPKRNGLFCVRTGETNRARLDFGCPFSLTSWRWSHYTIGACFETSATYGGRMLGIHKTRKVSSVTEDTGWDDEEGQTQVHDLDFAEMSTDKRMTPLFFIAETWELMPDPIPTLARSLFTDRVASLERPGVSSVRAVSVQKRYEVDVLCWLEVMNRTQRKLQLVFAIRFKRSETDATCLDEENRLITSSNRMFIKLRTGRDILRLSFNGKESVLSPSSSDQRQRLDSSDNQDELNDADSFTSSSDDFDSDNELDGDGNDDDESSKFGGGIYGSDHDLKEDNEWTVTAGTEAMQTYLVPAVDEQDITLTPNKGNDVGPVKHRSEDLTRHDLIGTESASKKNRAISVHSVGRAAKSTSKSVIKHSKSITMGTVKGTVSAGRAASRAIPVSSVHIYKPRRHEPSGGKLRRISNKDHRESLKAIKSIEDKGATDGLPGQLLPPDQSCRKVSRLLSDAAKALSSQWAISQLADSNSTLDLAFLRGSSAELGVKPLKQVNPLSDICCLIARCIYEGRWREELCVLYTKDRYLTFYAPLGKYPSLAISFEEITAARICDEINEFYPLPGLHTLAIDTAWKCHYISFLEISGRDNFLKCLNDALFFTAKPGRKMASEFDSYRMSLENSLTGTIGKWRTVSISNKSKHKKQRRVLNNRRMAFDIAPIGDTIELIASYVENLLTIALSFSSDTLNASETQFIEFLDEASRLPTLPLHEIDLSSKEALCIFINLYHCLLQHSLLVAIDGLPNKRSCQQFKRCSCYEIGSDVFSLAELECCVVRGQTSRASHIKPPFVDAPKASKPYLIYGVMADHRVNFILNNGDISYPSRVPVFKQGLLDEQIDRACSRFFMEQIKIDKKKRLVFLPKVCEVYALDFGMGDGLVCISQCLKYLDEDSHSAIAKLLEGPISVKYNPGSQMFHSNLYEDKPVEPPSPELVS